MFVKMKLMFLCFICMVGISTAAHAQLSIQSTANLSDDQIWIRPAVKIINETAQSIDLSNYTVEYYFYDSQATLNSLSSSVWYYSLGQSGNVSVSYEVIEPAVVSSSKKANFAIKMRLSKGTLNSGNAAELKLGINSVLNGEWHAFDQTDDWSFVASAGYMANENIVVKNAAGEVIFGEVPKDDTVPRPYGVSVYWLGIHTSQEMDEISLSEGDAFRNSEDGIAYVYYQDNWQILDDNSMSGGTMPDSNSHISMSGSNITEVGTLQSNSVTVSSTVIADRFIGDGSGITNIMLEDGSVLFSHLNASTLDALVAYISERLDIRTSVISVLSDASARTFKIHRSGSSEGEIVVSYVVTKVTGATIANAVILADGETLVEIPAFAGDIITISDNPVLYQLDPLNTSASLPLMRVSLRKRNPIDPNDYVFVMERDYPIDIDVNVDFRMTFLAGGTYDISLPFAAGSVSEPWSVGLGYGDKIEVLPSSMYNNVSGQSEVVFSKMTVGIEKRNPDDPSDYVFVMNRDFPVNEVIEVDFRMTFVDGSTYDITLPFAAGSLSEPWSVGLGYGDKVEILPNIMYEIDPSATEVVFPKMTVGIEKRNPLDPDDFVFVMNRDFPVSEVIDVDFRMTFVDGSTYDISLPFASGSVSEPWSVGLGVGDAIEILSSINYEIDPAHRQLLF